MQDEARSLFFIDVDNLHPDVRKLYDAQQSTNELNKLLEDQDMEIAALKQKCKNGTGLEAGRARIRLTQIEVKAPCQTLQQRSVCVCVCVRILLCSHIDFRQPLCRRCEGHDLLHVTSRVCR